MYPSSHIRGCTSEDICKTNSSYWCCDTKGCNYDHIDKPTDRAPVTNGGANGGTNNNGNTVGCAVSDTSCLQPDTGSDGTNGGTVQQLDATVLEQLGYGIMLHPQGDPNSSNKLRHDTLTVFVCFLSAIFLSWMVCRSRT